jgi:hypothetical protein
MNKVEFISRHEATDRSAGAPRALRSAPKAAKVLLPVWGYHHVRYFLEWSLPTLLAAGNLPAIAAVLPTECVIMTSADDEEFVRQHPAFKALAASCKVAIRHIDHLITDGNYSTTITLAYTESLREVGDAVVDTCFFFLVSDYIMADNSLGNAVKRMLAGASAVVVGNCQVVLEDAMPWLQQRLARTKQALALNPRELMAWALNHLHPATLANTVNIPFNHNSHTNRLFWRVDGNTMLGRFYLMHMLCVRPEVTNFVIGSSCDYSFIPEMCPSGNVETITDSDEYLVVELQPRSHEAIFLRPGPLRPRELAKSLREWTTAVHRDNAHKTLVFHAGELPADMPEKTAEADSFVNAIAELLKSRPRPHRGHPYWYGAMAAFYDAKGHRLNDDEWRYALGLPAADHWISKWLLQRAKYALTGKPPHVMPWHPDWPDFRAVLEELNPYFADPNQKLLTLSNGPTALSVALADNGERTHRMRSVPFLKVPVERLAPLRGAFDICLLELAETDLRYGNELIDRIVPLLKVGGRIVVFVRNPRISDKGNEFTRAVTRESSRLIRSGATPVEARFVPVNVVRRLVRRALGSLRNTMNFGPWIGGPISIVGGGLLLGVSFVGNVDALRTTRRKKPARHNSSFIMRLSADAPRIDNGLSERSLEVDNIPSTGPSANLRRNGNLGESEETREPQYNRCVELKDSLGLTSLGLMTNQVWYDDPRRLTFLLARYKFVAKMFSGRTNVGEVGCGDAFGTRVVLQEAPNVTVYDFDPIFIEDIQSRYDSRWPLKAVVHDIVESSLPRKHDALFSLDVIEHITPSDEHSYLAHLCDSLTEDGLLIIGTPSLESQLYASPLSKAGHINCKTSEQLKALLEKYFGHVFMYSMNDEVVHTGFSRMAHYLFALCTGPKVEVGDLKRSVSQRFEICELKSAPGFYVQVTHPNNEQQRIDGFATVGDAARWISEQSQDWLRAGRPKSY